MLSGTGGQEKNLDASFLRLLITFLHLFFSYGDSRISRVTLKGAGRECKIFGAFVFGRNVYLPSHQDKDFVYSIVSVHIWDGYYLKEDMKVVTYFGFQRLGVAVPLRPGDVLIINPLEPHSVSSRCYESDEVFCFSAYLKSSNVGLHDNRLQLTPVEQKLSDVYYLLFKS